MMLCPTCRRPLISLEFQTVETDFCTKCEGLWLDHGELGLILRDLPDFMPEWNARDAQAGEKICPHCARQMKFHKIAGAIAVDICPHRHGIWLDKGEMQAIIAAVAPPQSVAAIAEFCRSVFGKGAHA